MSPFPAQVFNGPVVQIVEKKYHEVMQSIEVFVDEEGKQWTRSLADDPHLLIPLAEVIKDDVLEFVEKTKLDVDELLGEQQPVDDDGNPLLPPEPKNYPDGELATGSSNPEDEAAAALAQQASVDAEKDAADGTTDAAQETLAAVTSGSFSPNPVSSALAPSGTAGA